MARTCIPLEQAFWSRVDKRGEGECWLWRGSLSRKGGYGALCHGGKTLRATRVAWSLAHGRPFPDGLLACHSCDNPPCVNPAHIWAGTAADNMRDALAKGRVRFAKHCVAGHPRTPENTHRTKAGPRCLTCRPLRGRRTSLGADGLCTICGHDRADDYRFANGDRRCRSCSQSWGRKNYARLAAIKKSSEGTAA